MKYFLTTLCFLTACLGTTLAQSQLAPKRSLGATRLSEKITLDADFKEAAWQQAEVANNFYVSWPNPGRPASERTEVRVLYDDQAIYFAFQCYDHRPDSVYHRTTQRDALENTDFAAVIIDSYRDGQNAVLFAVSPENVQFDSKFSIANANANNGDADGEDSAWDAVWGSAARLTDYGWAAEFAIPYSALRFPKKDVQEWSVNFYRRIARNGESDSWNEIKAEISGSLNQMGILTGVNGIKAPLRLSATPFVAAYSNQYYKQPGTSWSFPYSVGMDVKYGLNEAFTLDATVIPDFGQVRSDQRVLNLSPFEVRFQENRPFFTEGTELFNKGGLFYSRRIGGLPLGYYDAYDAVRGSEEVTDNPTKPLLLNATKVSGRTRSGLGVGLFNAVEAATTATLTDAETGAARDLVTAPLTNKSVLVLDQNLPNNSSVTWVNTNVVRSGVAPDANVSGLVFNLKTPKQDYGVSGKVAMSNRYGAGVSEHGYTVALDASKTSGNFLYGGSYVLESDRYNPNDLGFLYAPNSNEGNVWINYSRYKPWWKLNNFWSSAWIATERLYRPNVWTGDYAGINFGGNTRSFHNFGMNINTAFRGENDYFEAGTADFSRYYHLPRRIRVGGWYNSDHRKKLTFNAFGGFRKWAEAGRRSINLNGGVRWRASDKMTIGFNCGPEFHHNNVGNLAYSSGLNSASAGYEEVASTAIVLGRRDILGMENVLECSYAFTNRANLALFVRHYWNRVRYHQFYELQTDGSLRPSTYTGHDLQGQMLNDEAVNYFNVDCVFTWRFAPGSDFLVVYKNGVFDYRTGLDADHNYGYNAAHLTDFAGQNTFSVKVLYFLDYQRLRQHI